MKKEPRELSTDKDFHHPLLENLTNLAARLVGIKFIVVFPKSEGWGQVSPTGRKELPDFCLLIQGTKEGAKHCKMCHILMSIAACSKGLAEQCCHAGASVLATPISPENDENLAVLGTCTFTRGNSIKAWKEVQNRGKKLGVNLKKLKKAYHKLPELSPVQLEQAREILTTAAEAVKEIRTRHKLESELRKLRDYSQLKTEIEELVEKELKESLSASSAGTLNASTRRKEKIPPLIRVVSALVARMPNMPYSVAEIAAAARMTPNHFSTLFQMHEGQSFTEFLIEKRIAMAKALLRDLTLNICEIANKVGYYDAGYFSRRFKKVTGLTPSEWRSTLSTD